MSINLPTRSFPAGLDCKIMRSDMLLWALSQAADPYDWEHATPYLYRNLDSFRIQGFTCKEDLQDIWITLDKRRTTTRLVDLLAAHPELADPN